MAFLVKVHPGRIGIRFCVAMILLIIFRHGIVAIQNPAFAQIGIIAPQALHLSILDSIPFPNRSIANFIQQQFFRAVACQVKKRILGIFIGTIEFLFHSLAEIAPLRLLVGMLRVVFGLGCVQFCLHCHPVNIVGLDRIVEYVRNLLQLLFGQNFLRRGVGAAGEIAVDPVNQHGVFRLGDDVGAALIAQDQQQLGSVRCGIIPLVKQAQVHAAGEVPGEIVLPGITGPAPDLAVKTVQRQFKVHVEVLGRIEHTGDPGNFGAAVRAGQGTHASLLQENTPLPDLEGNPLLQQLQVILICDFLEFVRHFQGIAGIGPLERIGDFRVVRDVVHQLAVRVVAFGEGIPLLHGGLDGIAAVAVKGQNVPGLFHRVDGFAVFVKRLGVGLRADGHILQPQGVHHGAAHQYRRQCNHRRDQHRFTDAAVIDCKGALLPFYIILGVNVSQRDENILSRHTAIPSFARAARSFPRVRWSWVLTLLSLMP